MEGIAKVTADRIAKEFGGDRIERVFEEAGLVCLTKTHPLGHRCGYVAVPSGHPMYGKDYEKIHATWDVDVDGGLTFSRMVAGMWVIGWDAAHAWHGEDRSIMDPVTRAFHDRHPEYVRCGLVVSADMAEEETRRLARQMAACS